MLQSKTFSSTHQCNNDKEMFSKINIPSNTSLRQSHVPHWSFPQIEVEFSEFRESDKSLKHELESV